MSNPNNVHSAAARTESLITTALSIAVVLMIPVFFSIVGKPVVKPTEAKDSYGVEVSLTPKSFDENPYTWYEPNVSTPNCGIINKTIYSFVEYHSEVAPGVRPKESICLTKPQAEELAVRLVAENIERINAHNSELDSQIAMFKTSTDLPQIITWLCSGSYDRQYWASEITLQDATWAQLMAYQNYRYGRTPVQLANTETPFLYAVGKQGSASKELAEHLGTLLGTGPVQLSCEFISPPSTPPSVTRNEPFQYDVDPDVAVN